MMHEIKHFTTFNSKTGKVLRRDYYGNFTKDDWVNLYLEGLQVKLANFVYTKHYLGTEMQLEYLDEFSRMVQFMKDRLLEKELNETEAKKLRYGK